ncbi:PAS domain-containing protein [Shewanella psychrotolerans]|uniref:PAS domain-containing protein n=1 Tax=Shewanella psychrotolerans TaxID=2864206 RepID=UPI001C65BCD1|nr:PAS domain-containing protein [Shewanella psychrotolerans]QYK00062.1 PAS domain-containing protein [Shewanella psychrotolerans]
MVIDIPNKVFTPDTKWKNSLIFKFTIVQFVVATLIITLSIWLIFSTEKKHHMDTQLSLSQNYGQSVIAQLQNILSKIDVIANSIGIIGETYKDQPQIIDELLPSLLTVENKTQLIAGGGIWPEPHAFLIDKQFHSFFWARNKADKFTRVNGYDSPSGPGYHQEKWYQPVKYFQNSHTHWSETYIDPFTKEVMITASVPMRAEHQFIGVATVDVSLAGLNKYFNFSDQNPLSKGYILALDGYNNLLSAPFDQLSEKSQNPSLLGQPLHQLIALYPELAKIEDAVNLLDQQFYEQSIQYPAYQTAQLQALLDNTPKDKRQRLSALINSALQPKPFKANTVTLELASSPLFDEPVLVSILTMAQTQWKIILVTPLSSLSQQANAIAIKLGAFLLLAQLLALIILFVFQHKLFIIPIFKVVSALQSGNLGQLELDANKRHDELGQLSKAFIARSNQLEIAYASLDASNLALEQQLAMQRIAQTELETKKELINSLLNASQNVICIKDTDGRYTLVNDKFCEILGVERNKILGTRDVDIYPENIAQVITSHDAIIKATDNAQSFEQPMPTIYGERVFLITKYPIKDTEGNLIALGAMAMDINSLKEKLSEQEQTIISLSTKVTSLQQAIEQHREHAKAVLIEQKNSKTDPDKIGPTEVTYQKLMLQMITELNRQQLTALEQLVVIAAKVEYLNESHPHSAVLMEKLTEQIDILRHTKPLLAVEQQSKSIMLEPFLQDIFATLAPKLSSKKINWTISCTPQLSIAMPAWHLFTLCYQLINNTIFHAFPDDLVTDKTKQLQVSANVFNGVLKITFRDTGVGITSTSLDNIKLQLNDLNRHGTLVDIHHWLLSHYDGCLSITSVATEFTEIECQLKLPH